MPSLNPFRRVLRRLFGPSVPPFQPIADLEVVLDGASAVAVTEACIAEAAGLSASVPADALARTFATEKPVNLLGQAVHRVGAADPRGAVASALGLSMSGLRSTAFFSGSEITGAHDQLMLAVHRHLPVVLHLTCRAAAGPGIALGSGHETYHAVADAGLVQLFASNAQEAVDFTLIARRLAEQALVPVVVAMDGAETARSVQNVRIPSAEFVKLYLGAPDDTLEAPTPAQEMLFGGSRRRVPRWYDLDHPMLSGAVHDGQSWQLGAMGQRPFFTDHVGEILDQALEAFGRSTGRQYELFSAHEPTGSVVVVAQGAAAETARAVAEHLRTTRKLKICVVGVKCSRPFPGARLAELTRGKTAVIVLDRVDAPLSGDGPLAREVRVAMQRALANSRDPAQNPGYPAWTAQDHPQLLSVLYGLGGAELRAADLAALCSGVDPVRPSPRYLGVDLAPTRTRLPKRQVLLDELKRSYPRLGELAIPPAPDSIDVRVAGAVTLAVHRLSSQGGEGIAALTASMLHAVAKGQLRGRAPVTWDATGAISVDRFTYAPANLADPGDDVPVDVALLATRGVPRAIDLGDVVPGGAVVVDSAADGAELWGQLPTAVQQAIKECKLELYRTAPVEAETAELAEERLAGALLGVVAALGRVELKPRRLAGARAAMLEDLSAPERELRGNALVGGFETVAKVAADKLAPRAAVAETVDAPFAVRHLKTQDAGQDAPADSLPRFWNQVGVFYREGIEGELTSDPYFASGVVPPLSAAFRDHSDVRTVLPAFDPTKCTGCAKCWTVCPDSAIGPLVIGAKPLLEAGIKLAKERGDAAEPLRMMVGKLAPRVNKYLKTADPLGGTAAEILDAACSEMVDAAPLPDDRKAAVTAAFKAVMNAVGRLPAARTNPFFYDPERAETGAGELLALAINADTCKGCQACIKACEPAALSAEPSDPERVARTRRTWELWQKLPDTSGATIARASEHAEVGELPALLLSRHCLMSMAGGDGAEPGSGAKVALRLALAAAEGHLQKQLQQHANDVAAQRDKVDAGIRERLSRALPTGDLDALSRGLGQVDPSVAPTLGDLVAEVAKVGDAQRLDAVELQRLIGVAKELGALHHRLTEGEYGFGRARLGMVLAPSDLTRGIGGFPYNPFQIPVVIDASGEAASFARGALEGQLSEAAHDFALLRRAALELSNSTEATFREPELRRLTWEQLGDDERKLCPPLLLCGTSGAFSDRSLAQLLDSRLPAKLLLLSDGGDDLVRSGASIDRANLGLLGLALGNRRTFVAQSSISEPGHLAAALRRALGHDGPALIHVHAPCPDQHGFARDTAVEQAALAVATRTFPLFVFDPAADGVFGTGLELGGNPDLEAPWSLRDGAPLTPVDWAATESRFAGHFSSLGDGDAVSIADHVAADPASRRGAPFAVVGGERRAVSPELAGLAEHRQRDWQVLQELAGIVTPFTARVRTEADAAVAAEHEQAIAAVKQEYEDRISGLRDEYRAEMAQRIKERLLALAASAQVGAIPSSSNGERTKQS